ncbi:hypothetical protein AB6A40_007632 [Gnathostoma spinigerum]|uniref:Golgi apparatus protein 1 n=1 Tax=Gnathostoma spinigerum TaxID=75299 RepID=A0ABD6EV43_9BILA
MWSRQCLLLLLFCYLSSEVFGQNQAAIPQQNQGGIPPQQPPAQQGNVNPAMQQQQQLQVDPNFYVGSKRLIDHDACKEDIHKYCSREGVDLKSDLAVLECLQDTGLSETQFLSSACEHLVWEYKINLTQDVRFRNAAAAFCSVELKKVPGLEACNQLTEPGYALSCMLDYLYNITPQSDCFQFLVKNARLAFSDFRVVGPFVTKCRESITRAQCGSLTPPSAHAKVRVPHSQGSTVECLVTHLIKQVKEPKDALKLIDEECRHEIMRIAELQSDDFHLDRTLFFSCRVDREKFCKNVESGGGKVFECLLAHRTDKFMEPQGWVEKITTARRILISSA